MVDLGPRALLTVAGVVMAAFLAFAVGSGRLSLAVPEPDEGASLWLVFLTGLSVGSLTCLAVQGGLLATTIAGRALRLHRVEGRATDHVAPVVQFLAAKLAAYTALGALLGYFGSLIPLGLQGWLLIAVGVFMVVVVLQMFDVHPFFRRFAFRPPRAVQQLMRQESKRGDAFAPALLGALTVFMPCGVTLAMEGLAVASNDPMRGALIMAAFTLGTSPLFLLLGFLATQAGRSAFRVFQPIAAVVIVAVGFMSILSGARLLGYGGSLVDGTATRAVVATERAPAEPAGGLSPAGRSSAGDSVAADGPPMSTINQEATINVSTHAFDPARLQIKAGMPTRLKLVTHQTEGCIRAFVIPSLGVQRVLPVTGEEVVDLPPSPAGTIAFTCSMGMYGGVIEVVQ